MHRLLHHFMLAGLLLSLWGVAEAAPPPGTVIANTANSSQLGSGSAGLNSNTVNANVLSGNTAIIAVTVSSPTSSPTPGSTVALTTSTFNSGGGDASPVPVTVNGAATTLFVVNLPVPANTTFASAQTTTAGAQILYQLLGSGPNTYVTVIPGGAGVEAVAWALPALTSGSTLTGQLNVTVNANASTSISATASALWASSPGGSTNTTTSNALIIKLPVIAAGIGYYTSATYKTAAIVGAPPGNPLFIQVNAAACNVDPTRILTVPVTVTSQLTGDAETFTATETAANTGLFRINPNVPTVNGATHPVVSADGILEVLANDLVKATITNCNGVPVSANTTLLIDPSGIVYSSSSNQPVPGATVELVDVTGGGNGGNAGGPARVFQADGTTPAPSTVLTTADGSYRFPLVAPSTYKLVVVPPGGYAFPSKVAPAQQPGGRVIDPQASYGMSFAIAGSQNAPVRFDLPLDASGAAGALLIQKSANKLLAQIGDFIDYSVQINNNTAASLSNVHVNDQLPAGFTYQRGTARLNGAPLADPAGGAGPALTFNVGVLPNGAQVTLSYRLRIGVGAPQGTATNSAQALSGAVASNHSSAAVQVEGGVFSDKAYIIGKIFADCNGSGIQDAGEPGIPGVRIYLDDGTYVVSDEEGKYSLYGLTPRMHVAKVDPITLPAGTRLEVLNNRNALDPGSVFADLTTGELHKVDFAVSGCSADLNAQLEARRKALQQPSEIMQAAAVLLSPNAPPTGTVDARTLPAAGVIRLPGASDNPQGLSPLLPQPTMSSGMPGITPFSVANAPLGAVGDRGGPYAGPAFLATPLTTSAAQVLQDQSPAPPPAVTPGPAAGGAVADDQNFADFRALQTKLESEALEKALPHLDSTLGFVNLKDGEVLPMAQTAVQVKGPLGTHLELTVNGTLVSDKQVGKKSTLESTQVAAWEYIGVDLRAGRNTLRVRALDDFGNEHGSSAITVLAPGMLASILIDAPNEAVADGVTPLPVKLLLRDANDLPVTNRTELVLSASLGQWQFKHDAESGVERGTGNQVFVTGGSAHLWLLPPAQPGKAEISVQSGTLKATRSLAFTPNLRPLLAVGLVSGALNFRNLNPAALQPAQSSDVFEREIANFSSCNDCNDNAAARGALFLKGKVLGSTLLTLAYDSDKPSDTTLFRDIQPDQFYPVYGDSSARGYDAQSTGKLYVMVQNGTNYVLYGDYTTQSDNPARALTQYSRALTGAKGHWQFGSTAVDAFASETASTQAVVEFRANGTSGPFQLDLRGVTNSQQVDIVVRDRNQPAVILKDTPLTPFADYAIEPYTGLLLLNNPVPSVDANLNPVYIHVSYSIEAGGPEHWIEGLDLRVQMTAGLALGATAIHDSDPGNVLTLEGLNLTDKFDNHTSVTAELARSDSDLLGQGFGQHLDFLHEDARFTAHLYGTHTDAEFFNPNSLQSAGESQYGLKATYQLALKDRIVAEALETNNGVTGAEQTGGQLKLEHMLPHNVRLELGLLHSEANAASVLSAPALPGATVPVTPVAPTLPPGSNNEQVGYTAASVKATVPVQSVKGLEVFGLVSKSIDGNGGEEDAIGGTYALNSTTHIYAQHDFINSLNGPYTLNPAVSQYSTVAGLATVLPDHTQLFDEYRVGDGIDGRSSEAAIGLRHQWKFEDGIGLSASAQRIAPISGAITDNAGAITLGADYTAAHDWKASSQAQWEESSTSHTWLFTAGLAYKLNQDWTMLDRVVYTQQTNLSDNAGGRELARVQSGLAYRPVSTDVWNVLAQIEYLRDFDTTLGPGLSLDEQAWIFAGNLNLQPLRHFEISARYAAKRALDWADGLTSTSLIQLAGARFTYDLSSRWDVGLNSYQMWGSGDTQYAIGPVVGYLAWKNLWVSVGYNLQGFSAPDLTGESYTMHGIYLRLNFKFDESLLGGAPQPTREFTSRGTMVRAP